MIAATSLSLDRGGRTVVHDLDLQVDPGHLVALVGGDGAGKSTVLRALSGRLRPSSGTLTGLEGVTVGVMPTVGAVFGDLTVAENLAFARAAHGLPADPQHDLLDRMGLGEAVHRLGMRLSGGMRQKLGLAMALQHSPDVLLLDEPTTGVDPVSRAEIWRLLSEEVADGTAVVMATTYLDEAARAGLVIVLDDGHVVGHGNPEQIRREVAGGIVAGPSSPAGAADTWRRGADWHGWYPDGVPSELGEGFKPVEADLEDAVIVAALSNGVSPDHQTVVARRHGTTAVSPDQPGVMARRHGTTAVSPDHQTVVARGHRISGRGVVKRFGDFVAVDGVDIEVGPGEVVGLLGANGAGKTTLIRMLLGLLSPSAGDARLLGGPPDRTTRRRLGYVPQGLGLYDDMTVAQNRAFHRAAFGVGADHPGTTDIDDHALVGALPLGLQRRLAFEVATSHDPEVLVLDEPTSGVGPLGRARLWESIRAVAEAGTAVLVTTHHLAEAEQCDRLVVMADGEVVATGRVADIVDGHQVVEVVTEDPGPVLAALAEQGLVAALTPGGVSVPGSDADEVEGALTKAGLSSDAVPATIHARPATLEERFVDLADGATARSSR